MTFRCSPDFAHSYHTAGNGLYSIVSDCSHLLQAGTGSSFRQGRKLTGHRYCIFPQAAGPPWQACSEAWRQAVQAARNRPASEVCDVLSVLLSALHVQCHSYRASVLTDRCASIRAIVVGFKRSDYSSVQSGCDSRQAVLQDQRQTRPGRTHLKRPLLSIQQLHAAGTVPHQPFILRQFLAFPPAA